jgi:hypothetical protein
MSINGIETAFIGRIGDDPEPYVLAANEMLIYLLPEQPDGRSLSKELATWPLDGGGAGAAIPRRSWLSSVASVGRIEAHTYARVHHGHSKNPLDLNCVVPSKMACFGS